MEASPHSELRNVECDCFGFYPWFLALAQNSINVSGMNRAAYHREMSLFDTLSSVRGCLLSFIAPETLVGFFPFPFSLRANILDIALTVLEFSL